jgi:hypothetical protein
LFFPFYIYRIFAHAHIGTAHGGQGQARSDERSHSQRINTMRLPIATFVVALTPFIIHRATLHCLGFEDLIVVLV